MYTALIALFVVFIGAFVYWVTIPTWKVFFDLDGFWWIFGVQLLTFVVGGKINIPAYKYKGRLFALNLLGVGGPIFALVYLFRELSPSFPPAVLVFINVATILYLFVTRVDKEGVKIPLVAIYLVSIALAPCLHYLTETSLREAMFWGFAVQFLAMAIADWVHATMGVRSLQDNTTLAFGGAGAAAERRLNSLITKQGKSRMS